MVGDDLLLSVNEGVCERASLPFLNKDIEMSAGPFGLVMGMKKEDFLCDLKEVSPGEYVVSEMPRPHPLFHIYFVTITQNYGLSSIRACTEDIKSNRSGSNIKVVFHGIKKRLENSYGVSTLTDELIQGSIWNEPEDWMHALESGDQELSAYWSDLHGSQMKNAVDSILLMAHAHDVETGFITADYSFDNHGMAMKEKADKEDEVL